MNDIICQVGGKNISEVLALSVDDEIDFFKDLNLSKQTSKSLQS